MSKAVYYHGETPLVITIRWKINDPHRPLGAEVTTIMLTYGQGISLDYLQLKSKKPKTKNKPPTLEM